MQEDTRYKKFCLLKITILYLVWLKSSKLAVLNIPQQVYDTTHKITKRRTEYGKSIRTAKRESWW